MGIDWNDNAKRKALRLALERAYPDQAALRQFVDEELNENLASIAGSNNLQATVHDLITWARAKGRLDQVFEAFCRNNPNNPVIQELQPPLTQLPQLAPTPTPLVRKPLTAGQRDRKKKDLAGLQSALDLKYEKLKRLREELEIATSTTVKFELEKRIELEEPGVADLTRKIEAIEEVLGPD